MRWSPDTEERPANPGRDLPAIRHPDAYALLMDSPEYLTGVEVCRQDEAERDADSGLRPGAAPWVAGSMQPWGRQSAALGLAEDFVSYLSRSGEPASNPDESAQLAYCTEQFVKRFFVEGARTVQETAPSSIGSPMPDLPLGRMGRGRRCTYVSFATPQESPWPGHPFIGGYLDPNLGFEDPYEPEAGILLVTSVPHPDTGTGFWPLYRALNRTVAIWSQSDTRCGELVNGLARLPQTGVASSPVTARAVVRLLRALHAADARNSMAA